MVPLISPAASRVDSACGVVVMISFSMMVLLYLASPVDSLMAWQLKLPFAVPRISSTPVAHDMVTSEVDISIHIDMSTNVPDYNLLPDIGDIGSPVRNTIVEIPGIERPVIRHVLRVALTDADAGVVSASVEPESSHQKRCCHNDKF